jgi:membrane protease YdiL (CAAX protease family)
MAKFLIILRNDKVKQYNSMALFIVLLNVGLFILTAFYSADQFIRNVALAGAVLAALSLAAGWWLTKKGKTVNASLKYLPLIIITIVWAMIGNWWAVVVSAVLTFLFATSQRQLQLGVDKTEVSYPSFPQRTIRWNELNNIVLKDGLLTIDFKNNKILQSEIIESSARLNEQEFNDFCREQLK